VRQVFDGAKRRPLGSDNEFDQQINSINKTEKAIKLSVISPSEELFHHMTGHIK